MYSDNMIKVTYFDNILYLRNISTVHNHSTLAWIEFMPKLFISLMTDNHLSFLLLLKVNSVCLKFSNM